MSDPVPEFELDQGPALALAREFVSAVAWGEHR